MLRALTLCFSLALATTALAAPDTTVDDLIARGKRIVDAGSTGGSTGCGACHGGDGSGRTATGIPALAGQSVDYLSKQLQDFRSGVRRHFFMEPTATALDDDDIRAVAHYYSSLAPVVRHGAGDDWQKLAVGSWIAQHGIGDRHVPSCNSCHGEDGRGVAPVFPRLAGQSAVYIKRQLKHLGDGHRSNDPAAMMRNVAPKLLPTEQAAVAEYYEWLGSLQSAAMGGATASSSQAAAAATTTTVSTEAPAVQVAQSRPAVPAAAPAADEASKPIPEASMSIYRTRCTPCHGAAGAGDGAAAVALVPKPRSFADGTWQRKVDDEHLRKVIVEGGPSVELSPLMPPNPDLAGQPDVVEGLVTLLRGFDD